MARGEPEAEAIASFAHPAANLDEEQALGGSSGVRATLALTSAGFSTKPS
jgi:hypothetical protein